MKKAILIISIAVVVVILLRLAKKRFVAAEAKVNISDIDAIFAKLDAVQKDGSFAAFVFPPQGSLSADDSVNIQFSREGGRLGFDWVLLAPANLREQNRFSDFAAAKGYKAVEREMNGVKYLRVEGPKDLPSLCRAVILEMFRMPSDAPIQLIPEGFTWP